MPKKHQAVTAAGDAYLYVLGIIIVCSAENKFYGIGKDLETNRANTSKNQ